MNNFNHKIPCSYCNHSAWRHFVSIVAGRSYDNTICLDCVPDVKTNLDCWHDFQADNLKYLAQKYKELKEKAHE